MSLQALREFSARIGSDPLQIQGPGGNTSWKQDGRMWVKASGTQLAHALTEDVFVQVGLDLARSEIAGEGDGTCRAAMLDGDSPIRPSIETTFHAMFDQAVVAHTHSVNVLAHATSDAGLAAAKKKLEGMPFAVAPYRQPGLPLTHAIRNVVDADTRVVLLRNHGVVVTGNDVDEVSRTLAGVERCLEMAPKHDTDVDALWDNPRADASYWPDHVVFLGPGLPQRSIYRGNARLMLQCLADVLARVPDDWSMVPIGAEAEAALMNWDAETYRQKMAARDR